MAVPPIHNDAEPKSFQRTSSPGPITAGLLKWTCNGACGPTPFGGINGPDAASIILLRAEALIACLSAAFSDSEELEGRAHGRYSELSSLIGSKKALAMEAIGDLIMLAKVLVDEE